MSACNACAEWKIEPHVSSERLVVQRNEDQRSLTSDLRPLPRFQLKSRKESRLDHRTPNPHAGSASRPRARSPLLRCRLPSAATSTTLLRIRASTHTSQTEVPNPTHDIATHRIDRPSRAAQRRALCSHALDAEQLDARPVPHAYRALLDLHFGREDEGPEQGLVPAETERRPFEVLDADWGWVDAVDVRGLESADDVG